MRASCIAIQYTPALRSRGQDSVHSSLIITCQLQGRDPHLDERKVTAIEMEIDGTFKRHLGRLTAKRRQVIVDTMPTHLEVNELWTSQGRQFTVDQTDLFAWVERAQLRLETTAH